MKTWKAIIKEKGSKSKLTPTFTGNKTREEMIKFWGLEEPDVEYYKLWEV